MIGDIAVALRNKLTTLTFLPVEQGKIDFDKPGARVWFQRSGSDVELMVNGTPSLYDDNFIVEVCTEDLDQTQCQATTIRTALNGFKGKVWPNIIILGTFVSDAADDYQPKNLSADEGYFVQAFQVRILS